MRRRLDAGLLAVLHFQHLDLAAAPLRPARVHAQKHLRPVLALGAAGAGVDFEIGVVVVGLAREQRLDLPARHFLGEALDRRLGLGDDRPASPSASPSSIRPILSSSSRSVFLHGGDRVVEVLALAHDRLRLLGPVPEVGALDAGVQLLRDGARRHPSQRCLRISATALRISSTSVCVSARISSLQTSKRRGARSAPPQHVALRRGASSVEPARSRGNGLVGLRRDRLRHAHRESW